MSSKSLQKEARSGVGCRLHHFETYLVQQQTKDELEDDIDATIRVELEIYVSENMTTYQTKLFS